MNGTTLILRDVLNDRIETLAAPVIHFLWRKIDRRQPLRPAIHLAQAGKHLQHTNRSDCWVLVFKTPQ
jgi:hypothetical protein